MPKMTGGQAVVAALLREGVETVFGIPGVHTLDIYDALYDEPRIRHILARHEGGAGFMADGYARVTGKPGCILSITGPGVTNVSTALGQAYADGVPLVLVHSAVDARLRVLGNLHELRGQTTLLSGVCKWGTRVERVSDIPAAIHAAYELASRGWPGPTHVEVPLNLLAEESQVALTQVSGSMPSAADAPSVQRAAALLGESKRPLLYAGWGISACGAEAELRELVEKVGAIAVTDPVGKGVLPEDHPQSLGAAWRDREVLDTVVEQADLCLAVGTRLGSMETRAGSLPLPSPLIHIDPDPMSVGRLYPTDLGLVGDIRSTLARLIAAVSPTPGWNQGVASQVHALRQDARERLEAKAPEIARVLGDIRQSMGREGIVALDMTLPAYWASRYLDVLEPRTLLNPYYFMALGYALPAAIGAKLARPHSPVAILCGDGGFLFTAQELATAVKYGLDLVIVLFDNGRYGAIHRHQERRFDGRTVATELANPDFCVLAQAFGARAVRLGSTAELGDALRDAVTGGGIVLLLVPAADIPAPF